MSNIWNVHHLHSIIISIVSSNPRNVSVSYWSAAFWSSSTASSEVTLWLLMSMDLAAAPAVLPDGLTWDCTLFAGFNSIFRNYRVWPSVSSSKRARSSAAMQSLNALRFVTGPGSLRRRRALTEKHDKTFTDNFLTRRHRSFLVTEWTLSTQNMAFRIILLAAKKRWLGDVSVDLPVSKPRPRRWV